MIGLGASERGFAHRGSRRRSGTKWHWLATFEKVFIPDLQAQKRLSARVPNGLVTVPWCAEKLALHQLRVHPNCLMVRPTGDDLRRGSASTGSGSRP